MESAGGGLGPTVEHHGSGRKPLAVLTWSYQTWRNR
jgi:hypothetical protein